MADLTSIKLPILIEKKVNTAFDDFWNELQKKQDEYYIKHKKYFQALVSPESKVVNALDSTFVKREPSDEKHSIDSVMTYKSKIPFQIRVDEWVGKDTGYFAKAFVELLDGTKVVRTKTSDGKDSNWVKEIIYT